MRPPPTPPKEGSVKQMTEDNDKRGPPPAPPKEGSAKQMTEDNDKRGPPPTPPKEGLGEVGAFICKQFSIHYVSTYGLLAS